MQKSSPGFFTSNASGKGLVAAQNLDSNGNLTTNTPSNQVARGGTVVFYLTGAGAVSGAPADGQSPTASTPTPTKPIIAIDGVQLTDAQILYSGLGAFPGGWQINATVPQAVMPTASASVVVSYNGVASNIGGTTLQDGITPGADVKITTTVAVK